MEATARRPMAAWSPCAARHVPGAVPGTGSCKRELEDGLAYVLPRFPIQDSSNPSSAKTVT